MNTNLSVMTSPISKSTMPISSIQSTLLPSVEGLDLAGRVLEWQLKNDNLFPQLSEHLKVGIDGIADSISAKLIHINIPKIWLYSGQNVSGLSDMDYPMLEVGSNGLPLLRQMGLVNRIPLPPELVEHFGRKKFL